MKSRSGRLFRIFGHAVRALADQKGKTILMMLGTAVGIMLLTGVVGLSRGVEKRIEEVMAFMGPRSGMVFAGGGRLQSAGARAGSGSTLKLQDVETLRNKLSDRAVFSATLRREGVQVKYEGQAWETAVFAVDPDFPIVSDWAIAAGEPLDYHDEKSLARSCLIGATVARNLMIEDDPLGKKILINRIPFTVKGVLEAKGTNTMGMDMDDCVWTPLSTGMRRIFHATSIRMVRFKVREGYSIPEVREEVERILKEAHKIKEGEEIDFTIRTPDFIAKRIMEMTRTARLVGYSLAIVALLVGGIVLMNILLLSVSERVPEIGLKRAVGATANDIFLEFIMESVSVSVLGMLLGIILGFIPLLLLPRLMPMLPMAFSFKSLTYGFIFSAAVGIFFGVQPAKRASRLTPIEALR
ncbi:MAG TPA: ABC transporter permease [Acidobacteriota bacterium]|nr:ABC transporter permease [Acidobacteriota bacterium]HNT18046.1 ABC transporter permease [Acidobacteriota bacterium]HPA27085.1 ABC transporter permease [Acidobacteriota bacterium]HQO18954.1 ABC transporter permease [Acidobacteriota bacterium]HQQ46386.1 ABC transporter permease [Acidobacteriota bacterium]